MKSILIIDDEKDIAQFFGQLLEMHGFQAEVATGALEGIEKLKQQKYDAVICDNHMPIMFGVEVAEHNVHGSPFILISGETDLKNKVIPGIDCLLLKPFDFESLVDAVSSVDKNLAKQAA